MVGEIQAPMLALLRTPWKKCQPITEHRYAQRNAHKDTIQYLTVRSHVVGCTVCA